MALFRKTNGLLSPMTNDNGDDNAECDLKPGDLKPGDIVQNQYRQKLKVINVIGTSVWVAGSQDVYHITKVWKVKK